MSVRWSRQAVGLALLAILALAGSTLGQIGMGAGDDVDPKNPPAGFMWIKNGVPSIPFTVMDKNKTISWFHPLNYYAHRNYLAASPQVKDLNNKNYPRVYFEKDYETPADATRFWDARFGASDTPPKVVLLSSADPSVHRNCYQYSLSSVCKGKWEALVGAGTVQGVTATIPAAYEASTTAVAKEQATFNDIVVYLDTYSNQHHASVVAEGPGGPGLAFRYSGSPRYLFYQADGNPTRPLDTPMYYGPVSEYPNWTWTGTGAGNSDFLYKINGKANSVCRPK